MKKTPFHAKHLELGAKMTEFAGFDMPIQYTSIMKEHQQVREKVGIFDVSHMGEITVKGAEAEKFLDYLLTNGVHTMVVMGCMYTPMCYENGTVVDDLLVYKYSLEHYLLVVNASNDDKDFEWITEQAKAFDVTVTHDSDLYAELAVQGPDAEALLEKLIGEQIPKLPFFNFFETEYEGLPLIISRTGYTGEDGFEVFCPSEMGPQLLDLLLEANPEAEMIGLGARDTLRFEAALPLYGNEINDEINPIEARLKYFIDFDTDFIGKTALEETLSDPNRRWLIGFKLDGKGIARHGARILVNGEDVGFVTTGYKIEGYDGAIGLGLVPKSVSALGNPIAIQVRNKEYPATIIKKKFYTKKYKK